MSLRRDLNPSRRRSGFHSLRRSSCVIEGIDGVVAMHENESRHVDPTTFQQWLWPSVADVGMKGSRR
jgi:hypothetical protein